MYRITSKIAGSVDYACDAKCVVSLNFGTNDVDDVALESLAKNVVFQLHRKNGYILIEAIEDAPQETKETKKSKK